MSYEIILRDVRRYFGLRQQELGAWLGLSRLQLTRIETGRDPLPAHARPWLFPWIRVLTDDPEPLEPAWQTLPVAAPPLAGPEPLLARWHECQFQAQRLQIQLTTLQAGTRCLRARLAAGPTLQAALPPPAADEAAHSPLARRRRWLARLLEAATDGLDPSNTSTGPSAVTLLRVRQSTWLHEATLLGEGMGDRAGG